MSNKPKSSIPTHCALSMSDFAKATRATQYAKAILILVQNDHIDDDNPDFFTSASVIRTALQAAEHFLDEAQQLTKKPTYSTLQQEQHNETN